LVKGRLSKKAMQNYEKAIFFQSKKENYHKSQLAHFQGVNSKWLTYFEQYKRNKSLFQSAHFYAILYWGIFSELLSHE